MSDETKTLASYWVILAVVFFGSLILLRMADNKIAKLGLHIRNAKEYCIGKENRIDFCRELMSQIK
jgi:hypothetical protein